VEKAESVQYIMLCWEGSEEKVFWLICKTVCEIN